MNWRGDKGGEEGDGIVKETIFVLMMINWIM
jgi:hypothetical protein